MVADLEPFFDRVRALFPDTRGHGLSSRFERVEDYTYAREGRGPARLARRARRSARRCGAGPRWAAALSLWIAAHAPERVRAVVSISGPPFEPTEEDKAWWARHRPLVEAGRFEEYFDANVRLRMGEDALARLKARPDRYAELTGSAAPPLGGLAARAARRDLQPRPSGWTTAAASAARCRSSRARRTASPPWPCPAASPRPFPGARLHVVEGGPHFPNRTHRAEVQRVIATFLAEHRPLDGVRSYIPTFLTAPDVRSARGNVGM